MQKPDLNRKSRHFLPQRGSLQAFAQETFESLAFSCPSISLDSVSVLQNNIVIAYQEIY